jgi:glucokinase-like ROK family protein
LNEVLIYLIEFGYCINKEREYNVNRAFAIYFTINLLDLLFDIMSPIDAVSLHKNHHLIVPIMVDPAEAEIMRAIRRQGSISRTEISNITGWSKAKASQEIRNLVDKGYLREIGEGVSQGGRRPQIIRINDQLGYIVGIDIGATSLEIALADVAGNIGHRRSEAADVRMKPELLLGRCIEIIKEMVNDQSGSTDQILGIGVGVPGPVNFARGVLVAPPLMPDWENFLIRDFFKQAFPSSFVVVDNDVNIMALGEQRAGDGASIDHFIYVKIGTGIGAGIVSNGKIHRGSDGCAGDIGHICVNKQGPLCSCGNTGCLEAMAAGPAIATKAMQAAKNGTSPVLSRMLKSKAGILSPEDVNAACREGDQAALEIIRESGQMVGDVLASLVNFFNPSHIFIGGGISNFGNHLLVSIRRAILKRSLPLATTHLSIMFSRMGSDAGITGAVALALDYLFVIEGSPHLVV